MRLSLRFVVPLLLVLSAFAYAVLPLIDSLTVRWFVRDLDIRASLIANTVQEPLSDLVRAGESARLHQLLSRIASDERVYAVGFCTSSESGAVVAGTLPPAVSCRNLESYADPSGHVLATPQGQ